MRFHQHLRMAAAALLTAMAGLLGGCASIPASTPLALDSELPASQFNTGRVTVYVTDFGGQPLSKAMVNIESTGDGPYYRTAAFSDYWGRVTFNGVPQQVRISVYHAETQGNYSRVFDVPPSGTTELRMLVETLN